MSQDVVPLLVDETFVTSHPQALLADIRWTPKPPSGRERYRKGHLPGAVFVDLDTELSSDDKGPRGRHPLPTSDAFAGVLARLGIGPDTHVIVYDDAKLSVAARFWFLLRAFGHDKVSLLDGGLEAFGGALETGEREPRPAPRRNLKLDESRIARLPEIERLREGVVLLDARAPERYRGETEPLDRVAGHIPGAVNAPWSANVGPDGRFRPPAELRALYEKFAGRDVIASCGSGVTACHLLVAIERAGLSPARLYPGSYSEWVADPRRRIATGPDTG